MDERYINIGSEKSCCFVRTSLFLIKQLDKHPFLYYAVEEALECAKIGYYAVGILTFSQLLNLTNKSTPKERNRVAHEILKGPPTKEMYERVKIKFEKAAEAITKKELSLHKDPKEYDQKLAQVWTELIVKWHPGVNVGLSPTT